MANTSHGGHAAELENLARLNLLRASSGPVVTGVFAVPAGGGPAPLPDEAAAYVRLRADDDNAAAVYRHGAGSADGMRMEPGEESGLLPIANLNLLELSGPDGATVYYEVIP